MANAAAGSIDALPRRRSPRRAQGIAWRHTSQCASRAGRPCSCQPTYQAQAWSARDRKPIRKTFKSLAEAKVWRQEAQVALRRGTMRAPTATTLAETAADWLAGAKAGVIRTRSGERYKPSALRSYEEALVAKVLPALGHLRLSAVTRNAIQDLVDQLMAQGLAASTVRNSILPLRTIFRRAEQRQDVAVNPTLGLALPAVRGRRERVARVEEASALVAALPPGDRALWSTALYAGLRRGELQALEWADVDLAAGLIRVERSWDERAGPIEPKSRAGRRRVPVPAVLRRELIAHRLAQGRGGEGLVFGIDARRAFWARAVLARARRAWQAARLAPIGLHECRHTYAAFMIAAGVNAKALAQYMGHSSITVTLDRYGHLMPGAEDEAARMLDAFLADARAATSQRAEPGAR